jgi:proteasome assembly chaperone (PAC2) family protein|tara:strand:+ start:157 stop:330 length:174 start_codon:yes stop_codon:yes gene_type:complete
MNTKYDKMIENINMDVDIDMEKLKQRNKDISKVVNRYMRIKRKSFFRKILYLGLRSN